MVEQEMEVKQEESDQGIESLNNNNDSDDGELSSSEVVEDTNDENANKNIESKGKKIDGENMNKMREVEIEKIVLHCGGTEEKLEKSRKLLEKITGSKKVYTIKSTRRIPAFGISPGKQSGVKITIRDKEKIKDYLERFFSSMENRVKKKAVSDNQFCFGVHEYIEVPGLEYDRDIGISGFEVMVVFTRKGKRVGVKKIKRGSVPVKQQVTKSEIVEYLEGKFGLEFE
jgi:large subunit ribosomal protein L5